MPINIAADLQRATRIEAVLRGFKRRIVPILSFALVAKDVPLEGTDEVVVPFYDLDAAASKDFVPADGYVFDQDPTLGSRKVAINKRKYKPMKVTSSELRRQPALDPAKLLEVKGEKLAEDVLNDVFSVVKVAKFGASVLETAASAFDSDDVADLRGIANKAMWPSAGRALVLNADYDTALNKDSSVKQAVANRAANSIGSALTLSGFDYFDAPSLPENGERIVGFMAFMSAILVGQAPIEPTPAVRAKLAAYEQIPVEVAPGVTLILEYKMMADEFKDFQGEILECNYGYDVGNESGLKIITKPA